MFRLHDKIRRRICRAAFLLTAVPLVLTAAAWCAWRNLPWQGDGASRRLSELLGMEVRVGRVEFLRPGVILYRDLELSDPETGRAAFRCRSVEADEPLNLAGGEPEPLTLTFTQAEIETACLARLNRVMRRFLEGECCAASGVNLRLIAPALTLNAGPHSQTLSAVEGLVEHSPEGVAASARFCLAGAESAPPMTFRLDRNRQTMPPSNGFRLDTAGSDLPCSLLALGLSEFDGLGEASRFCGRIEANQHFQHGISAGWEGTLSGRILKVDLDALISERFPHKLSGSADLTIEQAYFRNGRVESAKGLLSAGPGVIGRSLVEAAAQHLGLAPDANMAPLPDQVRYRLMAAAVRLDESGLCIEGRCGNAGTGAVLADDQRCLLGQPKTQPQPAAALAAMLSPADAYRIPQSGPAQDLARRLPQSPPQRPSTAERSVPRANLRLHE
jgi:hypothetical protein